MNIPDLADEWKYCLGRQKTGGKKTEVLRCLLLSKPPYVFMPIARFEASRSHRLNQVAPPNHFFGLRYRVFSCIEWTHTELFLALTRAAAVVSPSLGFTKSSPRRGSLP